MLNIVRQWMKERAALAGRRLAFEEFEHLAAGTWDVAQAAAYRGEATRDNNFARGWSGAWMDIGARDANKGISRADVFLNQSYLAGWHEKMRELHMAGWRHPVLDSRPEALSEPQFPLLRR
ncbi:hypothetical protein [Burkholderia sp. LMU1-1-1.1]|uniref:hypothetical protein n=1 Tax=Burkholderia sp. LMU1-1-1.1 TaxID=3135266 RepID=UPI00341B099B